MIEVLKKQLEEENIRHEKLVKELEEKIKKLEEEKKRLEEEKRKEEINKSIEKVKAVPVDKEYVYFVPAHDNEVETLEKVQSDDFSNHNVYFVPSHEEKNEDIEKLNIEETKDQNVYFPPERRIRKKRKTGGFWGFIKSLFSPDNEEKHDEKVYTVPSEKKVSSDSSNDTGPIYMVPKEERKNLKEQDEFSSVIEYAKGLKKDKENHKIIQDKYLESLKSKNKDLVKDAKNMLFESQNKILLAESFLRNQIKEIRKSDLSLDEKTKLVNYVCGIAKMKVRERPSHLKEETKKEELVLDPIEELNKRKERIDSSSHFSGSEKVKMIKEIDDEILRLSKENNAGGKTL